MGVAAINAGFGEHRRRMDGCRLGADRNEKERAKTGPRPLKIIQLSRTRMTESPRKNLDRKKDSSVSSIRIFPFKAQNWVHAHFTNEPILVNTLPLPALWLLCPHFLDILEHHVAVSIEGFHAREQLAVIPTRNQDLGVGSSGGLEDRERTGCEFVLFDDGVFIFTVGWGAGLECIRGGNGMWAFAIRCGGLVEGD
jgi:hypothetical protein